MAVPAGITADGYEIQVGTNHLGHALLTKILLPTLLATAALPDADVRIVTLTSLSHSWTVSGGIKFNTLRTSQENESKIAKYGQSKLANILHSKQLACRYPSITCASVHPGTVETGLSKPMKDKHLWVRVFEATVGSLMGVPIEQGVLNQLWAATSKDVVSGGYYVPVGKKADGSPAARDEVLAARLWHWTEKELESYSA
jgi:NAD(P)-dependent dehydrogenase (short-subunit alcohol dehydrogenase family)